MCIRDRDESADLERVQADLERLFRLSETTTQNINDLNTSLVQSGDALNLAEEAATVTQETAERIEEINQQTERTTEATTRAQEDSAALADDLRQVETLSNQIRDLTEFERGVVSNANQQLNAALEDGIVDAGEQAAVNASLQRLLSIVGGSNADLNATIMSMQQVLERQGREISELRQNAARISTVNGG